ncbi:MAG: zinc ribbon domain-containing protein [Gemmataceae bacterium]|nr:zinc ribbon domain-containing protein [Gemmataceae bacterium]
MPEHIDPQHSQQRSALRVLGPIVAGIGLILTIIGFASFFASFGDMTSPRYFWCAFVGLPILGIGIAICKAAFLGAITRYMANEVAPVGKDVVNYMAEGTKGAVRDIAGAVGEGLRGDAKAGTRCRKCNEPNDADASFCKACGVALPKFKPCPGCGERNDADARFCDRCGKALAV